MSKITLPGLATGIDTGALIKQLIEANSRRLYMLQNQVVKYEGKRDVFSELQGKLNEFRTSVKSLSDSSSLRAFKAVTSDSDIIGAEAGSTAFEGSHSVQVKQLATSDRWVHEGFKYSTSYVGAGSFIFSYNNKEVVIQATEETTLQDLVGLINNDTDNPGVTAGLLKYDDGSGRLYHLVLSGRQNGSDYQVTINNSNTEVLTAAEDIQDTGGNAAVLTTKLTELGTFSGIIESGSTADRIHITGAQHDGTAVDAYFDVTAYTTVEDLLSRINDAFGATAKATFSEGRITLTDCTCGTSSMSASLTFVPGTDSSASLTLPVLSRLTEGGSVTASISSLAAAGFTETQSAQDSEIRVDGYPDGAWIKRSSNTIDDVIAGVTLRLHASTANDSGGYDSIEVNLTRNTEELKQKLQAMITAYNTVVAFLQENTSYNEKEKKSGILANDYSVTTVWNQLRSPFNSAVAGFGTKDTFTAPAQLGFTIGSDRMLQLDNAKFDEALVDDYAGVLSLIGASMSGNSSSSDIKFYGASQYTTAGSYEVRVYGDGSQITSAQICRAGETTWRDAVVSGNVITGNSEFDSKGNPLYPENSLQLTVDVSRTSQTPLTAAINVKQGFAGALKAGLDGMLDSVNGRIPIGKKQIQDQIDSSNSRIEQEKERLTKLEKTLTAKYARLEKLLSQIQQQMSGLTSMLSRS